MKEIVSIEECLAQCNKNNIAVHGIHSANLQGKQDPKEIAETIMTDGLALRDNWKSILATAVSFSGLTVEELKNGIQDYRYGNGEQCNVIISVPNFIINSQGEKIFLGFPPYSISTAAQQYTSTCILDQVCSKMKKIPKEFVYGYYTSKNGIVTNDNYYEQLSQEQKDELFLEISDSMTDFSKTISDATIIGDISKIRELKQRFEEREINEPIVDNALKVLESDSITLVAKNDNQVSNITEPKSKISKFFKNLLAKIRIFDKRDSNSTELENKTGKFLENLPADERTSDKRPNNSAELESKISKFLGNLPSVERIFGKRIDIEKLLFDNTPLKKFYNELCIDDIQQINGNNVNLMKKVSNIIDEFPLELKPDKIIEDEIIQQLNDMPKVRRSILTDERINTKQEVLSNFDKCVASYLMDGKNEMFQRFGQLATRLSGNGVHVNVGASVLKFGNALATKMEELQDNNERMQDAWKYCLPHILHTYTVSKAIGNETYNTMEHKIFEERLVKLGIIELDKNVENTKGRKLVLQKNKEKSYGEDKSENNQPVLMEREQIRVAQQQYINTGMVPTGYKIATNGNVVKETQIEMLSRKARQKEYEERRKNEVQETEKVQIMIGINGKPIPVSSRPNIQRNKQQNERRNEQKTSNKQKLER